MPAPAVPLAVLTPALDPERVIILERVVKSLHEKIISLEERLQKLEQIPKAESAARVAAAVPIPQPLPAPASAVVIDADAVKKNLLAKMWQYLNDKEQPAKPI